MKKEKVDVKPVRHSHVPLSDKTVAPYKYDPAKFRPKRKKPAETKNDA